MAQSVLMKQGLEGLFNPKINSRMKRTTVEKPQSSLDCRDFSCTYGALHSLGTGYDVYYSIESPTHSDLLSAIMGALPFVIIAVIEPTKIPLAGGFYKTKLWGWKI